MVMSAESAPKAKRTIPSFRDSKRRGEKVTMITVYDYPMARLVDQTPAELILVGDSLGMVIQGLEHTNPVTLEEMIYHVKAVRRGAPHTVIVGDLPFMTYQLNPEQALATLPKLLARREDRERLVTLVRRLLADER